MKNISKKSLQQKVTSVAKRVAKEAMKLGYPPTYLEPVSRALRKEGIRSSSVSTAKDGRPYLVVYYKGQRRGPRIYVRISKSGKPILMTRRPADKAPHGWNWNQNDPARCGQFVVGKLGWDVPFVIVSCHRTKRVALERFRLLAREFFRQKGTKIQVRNKNTGKILHEKIMTGTKAKGTP